MLSMRLSVILISLLLKYHTLTHYQPFQNTLRILSGAESLDKTSNRTSKRADLDLLMVEDMLKMAKIA